MAQQPKRVYLPSPGAMLPAAYQHVPIAPYTSEIGVVLPAQQEATDRVPLILPHPGLIVSMKASVRPTVFDPVLAAQISTHDFRVRLDLSETDLLTLRRETAGSGGGLKGGTVTLANLASDDRFFMLLLTTDKPNLGFIFSSKYPNGQGIPFPVQIDVTLYYIEKSEVPDAWLEELQ